MPITFVTGFFGMNFFEPVAQLFGWTSANVFQVTLGIMLGVPIVMYWWMRRRTWL
jgi:Mg2+ and Co2+ transporter CorA